MTKKNSAAPTQGWFPDPSGRNEFRYWDGKTWSDFVSTGGVQSRDPLVPAATVPEDAAAAGAVAAPSAAHTLDTGNQPARARKKLPVWAWVLIIVLAIGPLLILAPLVAVAAIVVLVTALVSFQSKTPTWLRFPSRGRALTAAAVSAFVLLASIGTTGAIYPKAIADAAARQAAADAQVLTTSSSTPRVTITPPHNPTPTADPEDTAALVEFAGTASTPVDQSATDAKTALAVLATLAIKGRAPKIGYTRAQFGQAWEDVDHNGCDTRNDILARDLTNTSSSNCKILTGTLQDPYSGTSVAFQRGPGTSSLVQIDHVVALGDAWQKGAQSLTVDQRISLANDPANLLAVSGQQNEQKGDGDAATWLPKNKDFRCAYVARQVSVKATYGLWVTQAEHDAIAGILASCPTQMAITSTFAAKVAPAPAPPVQPAPAPQPAKPAPAPQPAIPAPAPQPAQPAPAPQPAQPAPPQQHAGAVTPGAFCKQVEAGWIGYTADGTKMICETSPTDTRLRWRRA